MKVILDANCFIDAVTADAHANVAMAAILNAHTLGRIVIEVSRHTLDELSKVPDAAYELAKTFSIVPYWPIGGIGEQVATIEQLAGTWADARHNQEIQKELHGLAKSGNDLRDRGAFLDALLGGADAFVTSDRQLVGSGPANRILERFRIRVLRPDALAQELSDPIQRSI
jgi:predicted nucleic acid-binding protein